MKNKRTAWSWMWWRIRFVEWPWSGWMIQVKIGRWYGIGCNYQIGLKRFYLWRSFKD